MIGLCFICTTWGRRNGGINSVNYSLVNAMASVIKTNKEDIRLYCIVTDSQDSLDAEVEDQAKQFGIILKQYKDPCKAKGLINLAEKEQLDAIFWIGHDVFTGGIANSLSQIISNSYSAILHHMNYDAYYHLRETNPQKVNKKIKMQKDVLSAANVIFSIGPTLKASADDIISDISDKNRPKNIEIAPGLERIDINTGTHRTKRIIVFGRLEERNGLLKQAQLAYDAVALFARKRPEQSIKILAYGYADDFEENQSQLLKSVTKKADRIINLKIDGYIENQDLLFENIRNSDLCIMPSLHEGFGLSAYEAIAAGVPVIISKDTGLYKFLCGIKENPLDGYVSAIDIKGCFGDPEKTYTDVDLERMEEAIASILTDYDHAKERAIALRENLLSRAFTWEFCAREVISGCRGILPKNFVTSHKSNADNMLKTEKKLSTFLNETLVPDIFKTLHLEDKAVCKVIVYSNNRQRRFTVYSSDLSSDIGNVELIKTREIDEGTVGIMNQQVHMGQSFPMIITDFRNGKCYCYKENGVITIENADYGSSDHHTLYIITVPLMHKEKLEGAITFDIYQDFGLPELYDTIHCEALTNIYYNMKNFSDIVSNHFYYNIFDDITDNRGVRMIRDRVFISFGGRCPLKCKHCFAQELEEEKMLTIEELVQSIATKKFDVIYLSHYNENFYYAEEGVFLCEELYHTYQKDICITTRSILSGASLQKISLLNHEMQQNGNSLTFCISIPALDSYSTLEQVGLVASPQSRIDFAKELKQLGIRTLVTIRPLFPENIIPHSEIVKIVDQVAGHVDGILTGGLIVSEKILKRLKIDEKTLSYLPQEDSDYLQGVEGVFKHVDVSKEIEMLKGLCNEKGILFFKHSMDALNYFAYYS